MTPERAEQLLDEISNIWLGGQRDKIKSLLVSLPVATGQTRRQSLIEVTINYIIGFCVAMLCQVFAMWFYNLETTLFQNVSITLFFTVVSLIRSYLVRRYFNWRHHR